jgi:hypothetical protein
VNEDEVEISESPGLRYGFQIAELLGLSTFDPERANYDLNHLVKRVKLLLDSSSYMKKSRRPLKRTLERLRFDGLISEHPDVLEQAIFCFLDHTKTRLAKLHGLKDSSTGKSILAYKRTGGNVSCPCLLGPDSQLRHEHGTQSCYEKMWLRHRERRRSVIVLSE